MAGKYSSIEILPTHYEDPCSFWAQSFEDTDDILKLKDLLEDDFLSTQPITEAPQKDKIYVAYYWRDYSLYRCKLQQKIAENKYEMCFIDFGNCEAVLGSEILIPASEVSSYPPMAKLYRLRHLEPLAGSEGNAVLTEGIQFLMRKLPSETPIECQIIKIDSEMVTVEVTVNGCDLSEEILAKGFAAPIQNEVKQFAAPIQNEMKQFAAPIQNEMKQFAAPIQRELKQFAAPIQKELKLCAAPIQSEVKQLAAPIQNEVKEFAGPIHRRGVKQEACFSKPFLSELNPSTDISASRNQPSGKPQKNQFPYRNQEGGYISELKKQIAFLHRANADFLKQKDETQAAFVHSQTEKGLTEQRYKKLLALHENLMEKKDREILDLQQKMTTLEFKMNEKKDFQTELNFLIGELNQLCQLRKQIPLPENDVIEETFEIVQDQTKLVHLKGILDSINIKEALNHYNKAQNAIMKTETKMDDLENKITIRNAARMSLYKVLDKFLKATTGINLDERTETLEHVKQKLNEKYSDCFEVVEEDNTNLNELLIAYRQWKENFGSTFKEIQDQTDEQYKAVLSVWDATKNCLMTGVQPIGCPQMDLFLQIKLLRGLINSELDKLGKVKNVEEEFSIPAVVRKLIFEIEKELMGIEKMNGNRIEYSQMMSALSPCLGKVPDCTALLKIDKKVSSIKTQLRYKLSDLNDLQKNPNEYSREIDEVKKELTALRNILHEELEFEDNLAKKFLQVTRVHFPELRLIYSFLDQDLSEHPYVKNQELAYYETQPFYTYHDRTVIYKTNISGSDFIFKEYLVEKCHADEFIARVKDYARLASEELVPVTAIIRPKDRWTIYVQMPFYKYNLLERNKLACLTAQVKCTMLINLAKALAKLHASGIIHGAVHPRNILISDEKAFLAPFDFNTKLEQRINMAFQTEPVNGMTFLAPELYLHKETYSPSLDMFALGCIALCLFYPYVEFEIDEFKVPNLKVLEESRILKIVGSLLHADVEKRSTAENLLDCCELQAPSFVLKKGPVFASAVGIGSRNVSKSHFAITDEECLEIRNCLSSYHTDDEDDSD